MKILVLNSGSSSIKFSLFNNHDLISSGLIEAIGGNSTFTYSVEGKDIVEKNKIKDHHQGIDIVLSTLVKHNIIKDLNEIKCVGHRVVHGGEAFSDSVIINTNVRNKIKECFSIAPLHNPPNYEGIKACDKLLPKAKQVAVFDTAFHQTMPEHAYIYGIDYKHYKSSGIRRYGFHGTSYKYICTQIPKILKKPITKLKIIICHLGNGASVCAINKGKSIDTSMGFTPLEGLVMGTRCGDIDPAIVMFIEEKEKKQAEELDKLLNKKCGLLGISQVSNDIRELIQSKKKTAKLALDIFCYKITKYIGAYTAALNGCDAIVFTAGIGQHAYYLREKILSNFPHLGLKLDKKKNKSNATIITSPGSKVKALVIPTNEELMIAKDCLRLVR